MPEPAGFGTSPIDVVISRNDWLRAIAYCSVRHHLQTQTGSIRATGVGDNMQNVVVYEHHGKKYSGTFSLAKNIVKTKSDFGTRAAPVGKSPPMSVARWLLGEMVRDADNSANVAAS